MTTSDRDGLSRNQVSRINRLQMTRYRSRGARYSWNKMVVFMFGIICLWGFICVAGFTLFQKHWKLDHKLVTSLPRNLDEQTPSITIYADK
jgi:hypothetical protein